MNMNSERCPECGQQHQTVGEKKEQAMDMILEGQGTIGVLELLVAHLQERLKSAQGINEVILRAQIDKVEIAKCDLLDMEEEIYGAVRLVIEKSMGHA